ncbi:Secretion-associated RAS super family 2 isoform 1 [Hibiscus syriacus]|uniref:Secretion-associated RAS super family 2 isoform 1 n=1 Tax=Hibiscus syriacus TaxID=106335 RepID=A0A6A2ZBK1_HIBSY|nr:uncharacterized protein LOC120147810 [Hibiscus syriacus]KAE8689127.1 Secretion-associated RAS super family 2 isoform 1 [Hibiscus syriacus]
MGNFTSTSCFKDWRLNNNTAKVIYAQGNLRKVKLTAKAAELMLDEPGHIVSPLEELKRTRRVVAMRADDELLAGKVYVLVPMQRVNCRVTDTDMAIIEAACSGKKRRKSGGARVLPDVAAEEEEESRVDRDLSVHGCRKGSCRPWTPALKTIF